MKGTPCKIGLKIKSAEQSLQLYRNFILKAQELSLSLPPITKYNIRTQEATGTYILWNT